MVLNPSGRFGSFVGCLQFRSGFRDRHDIDGALPYLRVNGQMKSLFEKFAQHGRNLFLAGSCGKFCDDIEAGTVEAFWVRNLLRTDLVSSGE